MHWLRLCMMAGTVLFSAPVGAQVQLYYYCWAPDPATGVVHMSQVLPAGPASERARYGRDFADYLKAKGLVNNTVAAFCTMRTSPGEIAQSRSALPVEPCTECMGATRFRDVEWSRPGSPKPGPGLIAAKAPAERTPPPPMTQGDVDLSQPLVVVVGNAETGELSYRRYRPNLRTVTLAQARSRHPTGWSVIAESRTAGWGAATCVAERGRTRFFVAEGYSSPKQANGYSRVEAYKYAKVRKLVMRSCGAAWEVRDPNPQTRPQAVVDTMRGLIRQQVVGCDEGLPRVTKAERAVIDNANERLKTWGEEVKRPPCVIAPVRRMSGIGVRG